MNYVWGEILDNRKFVMELNARTRENTTPEIAKKLFDSSNRFCEELNYWIMERLDTNPYLSYDAVIVALEKAKLSVNEIDTLKEWNEYSKVKGD